MLINRKLLVALSISASAAWATWSWDTPHCTVTETGDLEWAPKAFEYTPGASVRYIDYETGADFNDGLTTNTAWKHHPWDPRATDKAAQCSGVHTYAFKRGVTYRGHLVPDEHGQPGNPIQLTSDPDWGSGEAVIACSERVLNWQQGAHADMPHGDHVWYADLGYAPRRVWLMDGTNANRIPLARTPNWQESNPDDVKSEWWHWTRVIDTNINGRLNNICEDPAHLTNEPSYYDGAVVWSEYVWMMGTPFSAAVHHFDPVRKALVFEPCYQVRKPFQFSRYFIEDRPQYLDQAGEYWFHKQGSGGRLYIWLPGDVDPNSAHIEAGRHLAFIDADELTHVHFSGLTFFGNNRHWDTTTRPYSMPRDVNNAMLRVLGTADDIEVRNCRFLHTTMAVRIKPGDRDYVDNIVLTDNEVLESDHGGFDIADSMVWGKTDPPIGPLYDVRILRNRLYRTGIRPFQGDCHGHTIMVDYPETLEIAGNIMDRIYGSGIFVFGGKEGKAPPGWEAPFTRILIHHNKVTDPLLNTLDWGGIETWQGGPAYVYANISGNPGGYWNVQHMLNLGKPASERKHSTARFGFAYYLDGAFKNYYFNNVAWGLNNDLTSPLCNSAAFETVLGFENMIFNNTIYKIATGYTRTSSSGRNAYLGNLWMDLSDRVHDVWKVTVDEADYDYENLAFGQNVFHELPRTFGRFEHSLTDYVALAEFSAALSARQALRSDVGIVATSDPVRDADAHDFRPVAGAQTSGYGVKCFVPWSIYRTIGEWQFRRNNKYPHKLRDEHWRMMPYYGKRDDYYSMKRFHLVTTNMSGGDFSTGPLENWCAGALTFNGSNQYATTAPEGVGDLTLDMGTNNFMLELYFKTEPGAVNMTVVSKGDEEGYAFGIDESGRPAFVIRHGGNNVCGQAGSVLVNDGEWHHVLVEVQRLSLRGIVMYIDGGRANGAFAGSMPPANADIADDGPFYVGRGWSGPMFDGTLEYLRLACGTLAESKTSIDELYDWQFNGPFLKDFLGTPAWKNRDAGAFEWVPSNSAPAIVMQPKSKTVEEGSDVTFVILSDGADRAQWRKDGTPIECATNSRFTVSAVTADDAGVYDVVLENAVGATVSGGAELALVPEPAAAAALFSAAVAGVRSSGLRSERQEM